MELKRYDPGGEEPLAVPGFTRMEVEQMFRGADTNGDGRVAGAEALAFFDTTGLSHLHLATVWNCSTNGREGGLTLRHFSAALRLVGVLQSGLDLSQMDLRIVLGAALDPNLPAPRFTSPPPARQISPFEEQAAAKPECNPRPPGPAAAVDAAGSASKRVAFRGEPSPELISLHSEPQASSSAAAAPPAAAAARSSSMRLGAAAAAAADGGAADAVRRGARPRAAPPAGVPEGLRSVRTVAMGELQPRPGSGVSHSTSGTASPSRDMSFGSPSSDDGSPDHVASGERSGVERDEISPDEAGRDAGAADCMLCLEARLPPLKMKKRQNLRLLQAVNGNVLAGPTTNGSILQWNRAEGNIRLPPGTSRANGEDPDSAGCTELELQDCQRVTCLYSDDMATEVVWSGHADGRVCRWVCRSGSADAKRVDCFAAHRIGAVTVIGRTCWGDLWTGSSHGSLRIWSAAACWRAPGAGGSLDLDRPSKELRRGNERADTGLGHLASSTGGQTIWIVGATSIQIWDTHAHTWLGSVATPGERLESQLSRSSGTSGRPGTDTGGKIDPQVGLQMDNRTGRASSAPFFYDRDEFLDREEQDARLNSRLDKLAVQGLKAKAKAGRMLRAVGNFGKMAAKAMTGGEEMPSGGAHNSGEALGTPGEGSGTPPAGGWSSAAALQGANAVVGVAASPDNTMWIAYRSGRLDWYEALGRLLASNGQLESRASLQGVTALCTVGTRVWVGHGSGSISVWRGEASRQLQLLRTFHAHARSIVSMCQVGSRVYSLAADGTIRAWSAYCPSPQDPVIWREWLESMPKLLVMQTLRVLCGTWNVNETRPKHLSLERWIGGQRGAMASIVCIGLQEVEMGTSSVAIGAVKDKIAKDLQEKGNQNAQWWASRLQTALEGLQYNQSASRLAKWHRVAMRQLSGMLVLVFATRDLMPFIGEVVTASVACGVGGFGGNKGAVAVSFSVFRRTVAVISSHFAAHQKAVAKRNADYAAIVRTLRFGKDGKDVSQPAGDAVIAPTASFREASVLSGSAWSNSTIYAPGLPELEASGEVITEGQGMRDAEVLIWMGDFNYRIDLSRDEVDTRLREENLSSLLKEDQCRREMFAGNVFQGLREGRISFQPTYKFDKAKEGRFAYDTSEKRRVPAWTDRIFFRGSLPFKNLSMVPDDEAIDEGYCRAEGSPQQVLVRCCDYNCCMEVVDSDHKPVYSLLEVELPAYDMQAKRRECSHLLKKHMKLATTDPEDPAKKKRLLPEIIIASSRVCLQAGTHKDVSITNKGPVPAMFSIVGPASQSYALPPWLCIWPVRGVIPAHGVVVVKINTPFTAATSMLQRSLEAKVYIIVSAEMSANQEEQEEEKDESMLVLTIVCSSTSSLASSQQHRDSDGDYSQASSIS